MIPDLSSYMPFLLLLAGLLLLSAVARRVRPLRWLISLASWGLIAWLLVTAIGERGRFDPYIGRVAALLRLDRQQVVGRELRIALSPDGHYWAKARIGGVDRRMLIDSGATITALSTQTAAAAGLKVATPSFPVLLRTANGTVAAQTTQVGELRIGNIVARDLAAVVSPSFGDTDVLGMNFLSRLTSWRVEDGTLILVPHRPQHVPAAG